MRSRKCRMGNNNREMRPYPGGEEKQDVWELKLIKTPDFPKIPAISEKPRFLAL